MARRKILLLRNLVAKPFAFKHAECLCKTDARDVKVSRTCEIAHELFGTALLQDELYSGGGVQVTRFDVTEPHYCSSTEYGNERQIKSVYFVCLRVRWRFKPMHVDASCRASRFAGQAEIVAATF